MAGLGWAGLAIWFSFVYIGLGTSYGARPQARAQTWPENEEVEVGICAARYETTAYHTLRPN